MAMRNFLLQNTMGTATYTYHATEVMKTLAQAKPGGTYEIKDWSKLELLAGVVGEAVEPRDTLPKRVADAILAEFNRDHQSPSPFVEKLAPGAARRQVEGARHHAGRRASTRACSPPRAASPTSTATT